uniref:Uncharacterized protein n=1 Tax=viral metagenome TaxID=1070528 RepID=A0A6M3JES9_9ZZZZ
MAKTAEKKSKIARPIVKVEVSCPNCSHSTGPKGMCCLSYIDPQHIIRIAGGICPTFASKIIAR